MSNINIYDSTSGRPNARALARQTAASLAAVDANAQVSHARLFVASSLTAQAVNDALNITAQAVEGLKSVPEAAVVIAPLLRNYATIAAREVSRGTW